MTPPFTVGVNLLWLVPGEVGGSEEYTVRLLRVLADHLGSHPVGEAPFGVHLYVNRRFPRTHGDLVSRFPTSIAPVSGSNRVVRVLAESTWLTQEVRRDGVAFVHHAGGTMPMRRAVPGIITLHDLQPMVHPERFGLLKRRYIRWVAPRSLRSAVAVACLTRFTGDDAVELAGVARQAVHIVPCGVDVGAPAPSDTEMDRVIEKYGLHGRRYVLYPAITYPHKNHEMLVASFARISRDRPDVALVLTGSSGPSEEVVTAAIAAYGLQHRVIRTGRVPESDLDVLYRRATMLAFPSLYEGFGLPALEAMSRGCPVIASRVGGLPEVTGGAAVLVDPFDTAGWVTAMADLFDHEQRRRQLVTRGFRQAERFHWDDSAKALVDLYVGVARQLGSPVGRSRGASS